VFHVLRHVDVRELGPVGRCLAGQAEPGDVEGLSGERGGGPERRQAAADRQRHRALAQPLQEVLLLLHEVVVGDLGALQH
jgi:hypothetical protein